MHIENQNYIIQFPKYKRKISAKLILRNESDELVVKEMLDQANIEYAHPNSTTFNFQQKHCVILHRIAKYLKGETAANISNSVASRIGQMVKADFKSALLIATL